jgi:hypothetical protein
VSYYMGDYYAGDYRGGRGDPGIFSFLRKAVGTAAGFIPGVGGALARVVGGVPKMPGGARAGEIVAMAKRGIMKHPVLSGAGAAGVVGAIGAGIGRAGAPAGAMEGMRGFHVIRKGPHAGNLARNRRMRVTNPRALRRAIRRAQGFAKLAKRVLHFTSPRAPRGRPVFRRKRARRV